jgi:hypothetical protein
MSISHTLDLRATSYPCFVQRSQSFSTIEEEGTHDQEFVPREVTVFMYKNLTVNRASIVFLHCESSSKCIILRTSLHATILRPSSIEDAYLGSDTARTNQANVNSTAPPPIPGTAPPN